MIVDYGTGTKVWCDDISVQPGWNGYPATLVLLNGNVEATWFQRFREHPITGIGGVSYTQSQS